MRVGVRAVGWKEERSALPVLKVGMPRKAMTYKY